MPNRQTHNVGLKALRKLSLEKSSKNILLLQIIFMGAANKTYIYQVLHLSFTTKVVDDY